MSAKEAAHIIPKGAGREYTPVFTEKRYKTVGQSAGGFRVVAEPVTLPF